MARRRDDEGGEERARPGRRGGTALTGRAAILAVVMCAIALSLAYPVREYVAQRQEIAQLKQQERVARREVAQLEERKRQLGDKSYIEREAKRRLHYCMPGERCYIVLDGGGGERQQSKPADATRKEPWYVTLWRSVQEADRPR
ncbi:hypothetical protein Acsp04_02970 [Actinomadura sp. NBRC 104425]|uniref:FtsB family cell division protein n=1 Tax=Actinomadura sp. NBRC 104425 TaxID=3032204 RepID=UPI0024A079EE|nr:septum formation initiator family protein [Actinomadura sp. NBRC 104425]GLZ10062.1 hypothetical protein Acsp04_02970 [Actinomadura sp. NBRC 104425]